MGCGSSSENGRDATVLGNANDYRDEDAEAATAAFASRQGLGSRVTANCWCKDLRRRCSCHHLTVLVSSRWKTSSRQKMKGITDHSPKPSFSGMGRGALSKGDGFLLSTLLNRKMDRMSKSDPFIVIKWKTDTEENWREIGRTEIITNDQNPNFTAQFSLTYIFEEVQSLRLEVYDADTVYTTNDASQLILAKQDFQGYAETTMAQVLGTNEQLVTLPLSHPKTGNKPRGTVSIRMDELEHQHDLVTLKLRALHVDKKDMTSSDPYLKFARMLEAGGRTYVFKTEVQRRNLNPKWRQIQGTVQQLSNGDLMRPLLIECWDYDMAGGHDFIGSCTASIADMQRWSTAEDETLRGPPLINPAKQAKNPDYVDSGKLVVDICTITERPSFLDYIAGGTEISFTMAIDYTASNGSPADPRSLHYIDPMGMELNDYAKAMSGIGRVLEFYDTDKLFPVIGFGGKLGPDQPANHAFAVNFQEDRPEVEGMAGVLQAYYESLRRVKLSGPTLFQQVIDQAASIANSTKHRKAEGQKYHVLCVLTDGIINDMEATIASIVEAADTPLSIVIVGVGHGDFTAMEQLDGDRQRLANPFTAKVASRDMVQFVPFREFSGYGAAAQHALAKHVLAEIPGQFISYMETNGIVPNNKRRPGASLPTAPGTQDVPGGRVSPAQVVSPMPHAPPMPPQTGYGETSYPGDVPLPYAT